MKRKVLHISCGGLGSGGVSSVIFSIVKELHNRFDFGCIVFKKKCNKEDDFLKYGKLHRVEAYSSDGRTHFIEFILRPFKLYTNVFRICKKEKYDVVHAHNLLEEGICLWAAKNAGVPIRIAHSHSTNSPKIKSIIFKIRERINLILINKYATHKIACSDSAGKDYFHNSNYDVIYNSIDLEKYSIKKLHKTNREYLNFIHVGRYTYSKNQEFVIKVFANIKKKKDNSRLMLVGFGEDKEKLKNLIHELNLDESVDLIPGDKVDVSEKYDEADYMIFSSIYEGFGIVLLEAQAKRIPCFVSEAIQKEVDAGLLNYIKLSETPEKWAEKILLYIDSNNEIDDSKIQKNLNRFNSKEICEQYAKIYGGNE